MGEWDWRWKRARAVPSSLASSRATKIALTWALLSLEVGANMPRRTDYEIN